MRRLLGPVVAALAATMLFSLCAGQAIADPVHCGDTITRDTTLYSSLLNCPGDGLVVGAANVTIDLNGHKIWGSGTGNGITNVRVPPQVNCTHDSCASVAGFPSLTVKNGTIGGFANDIYAVGDHQTFVRLTVRGTLAGCCFGQFDRKFPSDTRVLGSRVAGDVKVGSESLVQGSRVGGGVSVMGGTVSRNLVGHQVSQSKVYRSDSAAGPIIATHNRIGGGLYMHGSPSAQIDHNDISAGVWAFTNADENARLMLSSNRIHSSHGEGLDIIGDWCSTVTGNWVYGNAADGVRLAGGCSHSGGVCASVSGNRIYGNALDGIRAYNSTICRDGRRIAYNNLVGNGGNGIDVTEGSLAVVVEGNAANRNGADGIKVGSTNATVTDNRAWWNGNLGIEALDSALGSPNSARRNGNAAQCVPALLCGSPGTHGADSSIGLSPSYQGGQAAAIAAPPTTPTGFSGSGQDRTAILYWNAVAGASGYRVYLQQADGTWSVRFSTTTTALFDPGLTNCATYTYRVAAYDSSRQESPPSTSLPITPTAPSQAC